MRRCAAVAAVAVALLAPPGGSPAHRRARRHRSGSCRATCRRPAWSSTPQRRAVLDNHVPRAPSGSPRAPPTTSASSSGPRTPPTSTRSATRDAAAQIDPGRAGGRGAAARRRGARRAAGLSSNVSLLLPARGRGAPALRQAAPGAVRRVHPEPGVLPDVHARWSTSPATSSPGTEVGVFHVPAAAGRVRGAADDLLRGGLRRADARQRRGRRRRPEPARGADQQRHLRLHRRVRAAVRHLADPGHRARPLGRARLDGRRVAASSPRTGRCTEKTALFTGRPAGGRPVVRDRAHPGRPARCRARVGRGRRARCCSSLGSTRAPRSVRVSEPRPTVLTRPPRTEPLTETARPPLERVAVLIPTYNERETLPVIVAPGARGRCRRSTSSCSTTTRPTAPVRSPTTLAAADPQVHVLHRAGKQGLGAAYLAGFALGPGRGLRRRGRDGRRRLAPARAPADDARRRRARGRRHRLPLGARWLGASTGRCTARRSRSAATSTSRCMLGMPVNDATAGYRVYRSDALRTMGLDGVESQGYCFQIDLTWRAVKAGLTVVEVPITFVEREVGDSKMSRDIMTGVAAPHHRVGRAAPRPAAARARSTACASRGGTRCEPRRRHPYASRRRRPRCCAGSSSLLLVVPVIEIAAIIAVGRAIGGWQTLVLLVLESLLGAWIVKREGAAHLGRAPGGAAHRADAGPSALRRGPGAHRRHAAAHARASSPTSSASSSSCRSPGRSPGPGSRASSPAGCSDRWGSGLPGRRPGAEPRPVAGPFPPPGHGPRSSGDATRRHPRGGRRPRPP